MSFLPYVSSYFTIDLSLLPTQHMSSDLFMYLLSTLVRGANKSLQTHGIMQNLYVLLFKL